MLYCFSLFQSLYSRKQRETNGKAIQSHLLLLAWPLWWRMEPFLGDRIKQLSLSYTWVDNKVWARGIPRRCSWVTCFKVLETHLGDSAFRILPFLSESSILPLIYPLASLPWQIAFITFFPLDTISETKLCPAILANVLVGQFTGINLNIFWLIEKLII